LGDLATGRSVIPREELILSVKCVLLKNARFIKRFMVATLVEYDFEPIKKNTVKRTTGIRFAPNLFSSGRWDILNYKRLKHKCLYMVLLPEEVLTLPELRFLRVRGYVAVFFRKQLSNLLLLQLKIDLMKIII
jgi:hypothetical protein